MSIVRFFGRASMAFGILAAAACGAETPAAKSADASPSGAATTGHAIHEDGGASVFVVHEVKDFEAFKTYLEQGQEERDQMGVLGYILTRLDDGRVVIHFFAHDLTQVDNALKSERMQNYFEREGAPDSSLVWLVRDEAVGLPARPLQGKTFSLFFKLKTPDFAAFKQAFDERTAVYTEQSVIAYGVHRSTVQDDMVILHFVGTDHDKLGALPARSEFVEVLALAGGPESAKPLLGEDVVRVRAP
ncbi:MAG TPA: hypothetical protein VFZ53_22940 [Polyangiaceae bacterium]